MIDFDKAPPPSGGSVVRLAAVRASRKQRHELCADKGKVLTPVRRSARTPQQAVAPTAALLSETGYVYAPNVQLQPAFDAGDVVLVTEKTQAQALPRVTRHKAEEASAPSVPNMEVSAPVAPVQPPPLPAPPVAAAAEDAVRMLEEAAEMALESAAQAVRMSEASINMEVELTAASLPEPEPIPNMAIPPPSQRAPQQKRSHTDAAAAPSESIRRSTRARSNA